MFTVITDYSATIWTSRGSFRDLGQSQVIFDGLGRTFEVTEGFASRLTSPTPVLPQGNPDDDRD